MQQIWVSDQHKQSCSYLLGGHFQRKFPGWPFAAKSAELLRKAITKNKSSDKNYSYLIEIAFNPTAFEILIYFLHLL